MDSGGGAQSESPAEPVRKYARILASPTATPQQKASAQMALIQFQRTNGRFTGAIQRLLSEYNMGISGDQVVYRTKDGWVPMTQADGSPFMSGTGSAAVADRRAGGSKWSNALRIAQQQDRLNTLPPGGAGGYDRASGASVQPSAYGTSIGGVPEAPGIPDPSATGTGGDFGGTFFGNTARGSWDYLASNPDEAWSLYRTTPGANGVAPRDTSQALWGDNDFRSAMTLAPLLGGDPMMPSENVLGFADQAMKGATATNGQGYMDPRKVLNQAVQSLGNRPVEEQDEYIQQVVRSLEPYMDRTTFQMMMNRVGRALEDYQAQALRNPGQDQTGQLINLIMRAVG